MTYMSSRRYGGEGKAALMEADTEGAAWAGTTAKRAAARPPCSPKSCTIANGSRCGA